MSNDKILSKLQKILDKASSAKEIGSIAEAETFMAKANKMMMQYNLDMAEVESFDEENGIDTIDKEYFSPEDNGIDFKRQRVQWQENLASAIARAHNCRLLVASGSNAVWFVGRKKDRQICSYIYAYAVRTSLAYCNKTYAKEYSRLYILGRQSEIKGWIPSFFRGFTNSLTKKFAEAQENMRKEVGDEKYAIIVTDPAKAVDKWMSNLYTGTASRLGGNSGYNDKGYNSGSKFGSSMNVNKGVSSAGGQKMLGGAK